MGETEIDEYKLDTNQGKKQHTLRVSLINNRVSMIIINMNNPKVKFSNLIRLEQFRNACEAFDETKTIKEALNAIKNTIESGRILISEDEEAKNIDIKFNIRLGKKNYPPFVIGLPIDDPPEEEEVQILEKNNKENNKKENDVEVLPTKFDYQGDIEAAAKYGETTKNTTEYANPIIKSNVKKPNLILEYIEPILQVHYPDGTTKSTALPPRIQTADGKEPNINSEQLKTIHEQMAKSFNQSLSEYEKENNRSNSVSHKKRSKSKQSKKAVGKNNILKQANSSKIKYKNNNNNINNSNGINAVRSAMKSQSNVMTYNNNLNNIKSARTAFDDNERGTGGSNISNKNNKNTSPRDNINHRQNPNNNKGISDYSISSAPNKPLIMPNNYGSIPNKNIKINSNTINNSSSNQNSNYSNYDQNSYIQEVPKMINQNINFNSHPNRYQKGLNKSSSSPTMPTFDNVNFNFYQQNQNEIQTQYNYSRNPNFTFNQNQINNINLRYPQMQNHNFNQSQNPNFFQSQYQNSTEAFSNSSQDFSFLTRHNSSQMPLVSQAFISQINQQKLFQEQERIQAQKNLQLQQKLKGQKKNLMINPGQKMNNNNNQQIPNKIPNKNAKQQNFPEANQINNEGSNQQPPLNQTKNKKNHKNQKTNKFQEKLSEPIERSRNQIKEVKPPLKQSYSQQIIRQKPSFKNEITEQQIKLAEMASLQNIQNPSNFNASAVKLDQRFLDRAGNEETQSQYEREEEEEIQEYKKKEEELEQKKQQQNPINEADIFENLYRTEEGLIIFRNGLLHGIIHKFAEITDVVSKIQIMVCAGVKFNLLYRASEHGDRAKIFHEKCDNHQMTLVLVETTKGVRFGGFTTKTWDGHCLKKIDNDAFVFSLDKHKIYDIRKNEFAIGGYPKFGPVFFGCQIRIYDEFFKKGGTTCQRALNYRTKVDYELNNGEQHYIVKEIEVYDVEVIRMM